MSISEWRTLSPQDRPLPVEMPTDKRPASRTLPFEGAHNFRDMGGYQNTASQTVKWGLLYRADRLSNLSDADLKYIERLSLKHIIDLRSKDEREREPSRTNNHATMSTQLVPIFEKGTFVDELWKAIRSGQALGKKLHDTMVEANKNFVRLHNGAFQNFMALIADVQNAPLLFHCMAGKDRTGFGGALILTLLDVPFDTVLEDYLLTNQNLAGSAEAKYESFKQRTNTSASFEDIKPILGVHEDYLMAAFETIQADYGSFDDYMRRGLALTETQIESLRAYYLES